VGEDVPAAVRRLAMCFLLLLAACGGSRPRTGDSVQATDAAAPILDEQEAATIAGGFREVLEAMAVVVRARGGKACPAGVDADSGGTDAGVARCADCAGMAADLRTLFDRADPLVARAREVRSDADASRLLDEAMEQRSAGVPALVDEISRGLLGCATDPEVARVMERMPVL